MKCTVCFFAVLATAVCAFPAQQQSNHHSEKPQAGATQKPTTGASSPEAKEPGLASVLSQMDAASTRFRSAEADLTSIQYQKVVNDTDTQKGKVYFRRTSKELQMAIDITDPDLKYVLLTDSKVRLYQPRIDQVTEYSLGKNRSDIEGMFALGFGGRGDDLLKSFDVELVGAETIDGVKTSKLQLTPKTDRVKNMFSHIELWIDPARGISLRQQFWEPSGDYRLANYSNVKMNHRIPESVFKLKTTKRTKTVTP
jgi:outer membrane lipoprotein-sorting protein